MANATTTTATKNVCQFADMRLRLNSSGVESSVARAPTFQHISRFTSILHQCDEHYSNTSDETKERKEQREREAEKKGDKTDEKKTNTNETKTKR